MVYNWTHGIDLDSWYRLRPMVYTGDHGIDLDLCYRLGVIL